MNRPLSRRRWRQPRPQPKQCNDTGTQRVKPEDLEKLVTRKMPFSKYEGRLIADLPDPYLNSGSPARAYHPVRSVSYST